MSQDRQTKRVVEDALRPLSQKMGWLGKLWVVLLVLVSAVGVYAYVRQLKYGLVVTGMRDYVSWGIYISQFVFLVAVSLVGAVISSFLKLTNFEFRRPLTRIAEFIAVAAITFAAISILVDMGRPERLYKVFTSGRIQSPIIWDVLVVNTYLAISTLLLYIPMIPDLAYCRDNLEDISGWRKKMYRVLSLNWQGTARQKKLLHKAENILVVLVVPVAIGIHTVTSWLFATTYRPGWDSTAFGPYFVTGAFVAGAACVIIGMYVFRKLYGLEAYLTDKHFDLMGKLLVLTSLLYLYFNINEFLVPGFKMPEHEAEHLHAILTGDYSLVFWGGIITGVVLPAAIPITKAGRKPGILTGLAVFVVIGHWLKRFAIVIPTMAHPFTPIQLVPPAWEHYVPTFEEWAIAAAGISGTLLVITIFARLFPVLPIYEVVQGTFEETGTGGQDEPAYELQATIDEEESHA